MINNKTKLNCSSLRVEEAPQIKDWGSCHEVTEGADCQKQSITWQFAPFCKGGCHAKHDRGIFILLALIACIIISSPTFAKSNLKTKLSNFFQKIEKKIDTKTDDTASKTSNIRAQIASESVIIASTTKKLTLEDFGLLPQEQVKIDVLYKQKITKNFDNSEHKFNGCQGFTTDGEFFYVALLSKKKVNQSDQATKILKISMSDYKIVAQKDLGLIGHSNSLTYNDKTKKIYAAPLYKEWKYIYEFDTDLNNLKEIQLYNSDGTVINNKWFKSFTYLPNEDQYIAKFDERTLAFFNSNFYLIKTVRTREPINKSGTTSQALSTDGKNLYSVTNVFNLKSWIVESNLILVFDINGNLVDTYSFPTEFGDRVELQQISFVNGKCYGFSGSVFEQDFKIYQIELNKRIEN